MASPRCFGSGVIVVVNTPDIDHRSPSYDEDQFSCVGCPDCLMGQDLSAADVSALCDRPETSVIRINRDGTMRLVAEGAQNLGIGLLSGYQYRRNRA